jgi:hypothetical protein
MGCMDKAKCLVLFINNVVDWDIEDPKGRLWFKALGCEQWNNCPH